MEVTRTASSSRSESVVPPRSASPATTSRHDHFASSKRSRPDIVAPSSPTKSRTLLHKGQTVASLNNADAEARRSAELLRFADSRARAANTQQQQSHHQYPPGYSGDESAKGMLEQIKNRMNQNKTSSFLQKAKQVQQSLLDKQRRAAEIERAREEARKRESLRSTGFAQEHAAPIGAGSRDAEAVLVKGKTKEMGAFARATQRVDASHADSSEDDMEDEDDYGASPFATASRDEDLALVETLQPGPRPVPANPDDPKWQRMEPFSGHRLRERTLPHSQLKDYLRGRYHIPPSLLYSVARPITVTTFADGRTLDWKNHLNGDYEVPVDGDFVVIATIVEKSDLIMTKGFDNDQASSSSSWKGAKPSATAQNGDDPIHFKDASAGTNGKLHLDLEPGNSDAFSSAPNSVGYQRRRGKEGEVDEEAERRREEGRLSNRPRKFVILKLVDLGVNSASSDGEGSSGRGDNYLSLLAYEADQIDTSIVMRNTNVRSEVADSLSATSAASKKYVNGSRGAFEMLYKLAEGTVVAIMNPKILRPFGKSGMETKMLRLTPRSAEDCVVIGQAADYKRCSALKANGQRCGNFVDTKARKQTRTTTCDYHLSRHMDELARGRPEFAANSTSRFGNSSGALGATGGGVGGNSSFSNRRPTREAGEDSAINQITSSAGYKGPGSAAFSRAALSKKLNSSFGTVGDGMENNGGQVYCSQSLLPAHAAPGEDEEVRASDPSSWKYDVNSRYGRGVTAKQSRLRKQIEEEQLIRKIEARFAPPPAKRPAQHDETDELSDDADSSKQGGNKNNKEKKKTSEPKALPVLPNGSAAMINAAYSTLDQRKRVARKKKEASDAKRRKYTGVASAPSDTSESSKLKFMNLTPSTSSGGAPGLSVGALPIAGLTRSVASASALSSKASDSRSKLLSLAQGQKQSSSSASSSASPSPYGNAEPSLRIKKSHRPKLRLPQDEIGRVSKVKVLSGELVDLGDWEDEAWEDDLGDLTTATNNNKKKQDEEQGEDKEKGLGERIAMLQTQSQARQAAAAAEAANDTDSDLEII